MNKILKWILKNKANLLLFLASLISIFLFIEFLNYLFVINQGTYYVWPPNLNKTFLPDSNVFSGITGMSVFTINELGYRGPLIENKEREYRILAIGGSSTESLYLDNDETWPAVIMKELGETNDGRKVIVMNVGKSGYNTRDHIIELRYLAPIYKPDLVILMVGANDMLLKLSKRWVWKPFDEKSYDYERVFSQAPAYTIKSSLSYKIFNFFNAKFANNLVVQDAVGETFIEKRLERKNSDSIINEMPDLDLVLEDYERNLDRLIEISEENNATILFATQPFLWKDNMSKTEDSALWMTTDFNGNFYPVDTTIYSMNKFNSRLLDVCLKNKDVLCFDLEKEVPKSLDYFYDDMHFNENGAEFVGEKFVGFIRGKIEEF